MDESVQRTKPHRPWARRSSFIALAVLAVALSVTWLTGIFDQQLDQWLDAPKVANSAFIITAYPKLDPPTNATIALRLQCLFQTQRLVWQRLRNPYHLQVFPQPTHWWMISSLLHECMWAGGTRYMIANEVAGRWVSFGTTNTLDGTHWAAAAEETLSKNGLLLIHVTPRLVQVIPEDKLDQFIRDGLVKPGDIKTNAAPQGVKR
jgi:hypothetical protein